MASEEAKCFLCREPVGKDGVAWRAANKIAFHSCPEHAALVRAAKELTGSFARELVRGAVKRITGIALEEFTSVD